MSDSFSQQVIDKMISMGAKPEEIDQESIERQIQEERELAERKSQYWQKIIGKEETREMKFSQFREFILSRYKEQNNRPLDIDEDNRDVIEFLMLYFAGSERIKEYSEIFSSSDGPQDLSLRKGILLIGNPGSGKTSLFRAFSSNPTNPFSVVSCIEISQKYKKKGYELVDRYMDLNRRPSVRYVFGHTTLGWCFDDLGYERDTKHFGDETSIMDEIIFTHSNNPDSIGRIHVSTNLTPNDLNERYGDRFASRRKQLFNVIYYSTHKDRRR